jgi:iron complex transport system substrate-binding protein
MLRRRALPALGLGGLLARPARAAGPGRIVSIGGALTETVFALGAGAQIVAVDSTSRYPAAAAALPQVGYMRALPTEGIVALRPDLLLLSGDAGPREVVEVLHAARLPIATVEDGAGPGAAAAKARAIGAALGLDAAPLATALEADWARLDAPLARVATRPRVLFVLSVARGSPLVSGRDTHADAMIAAAGGENPVRHYAGYRSLSAEGAAMLAPEVILMMAHALQDAGGIDAVLQIPALAVTPAAASRRILALDGPYMLNFGPRAAHARADLARLLHPGLALPLLAERPWTARV